MGLAMVLTVPANATGPNVYKSTLDLSDVSDADKRPNGGSMVSRCVADLKPGVFDAPLRGLGLDLAHTPRAGH